MNRERLTILRDHLASLPDDRLDMSRYLQKRDCGTVACIAGWAATLFSDGTLWKAMNAEFLLGISEDQGDALFMPEGFEDDERYSRQDAIAAIQSMLDCPDDDALPVWPEAGQ